MVSICIATYNGERYIKRQLLSILSQLDIDDEIIISDDGSNDLTLSVIDGIGDNRLKVVHNCGLKGPVRNFENALRHAKNEYVFLSDQDDIWFPGKISVLCNYLKYYDLVISDCTVINLSGDILYPSFFKLRGSKPGLVRNFYKNSYIGCCMALRKEVLNYALPFPKNLYMHDWWIGMLVEIKGKVLFHDEPLMFYVRHGNNASPTGEAGYKISKKIKNRIKLLGYLCGRLLNFI